MSYDPTIGRWTAEDPIAFKAGDANLYRYVGNEPTDQVDPSGLQGGKPPYPSLPPAPGSGFWYDYYNTRPKPRPTPTAPTGSWTPDQFFGPFSPLIPLTGWGCGGLAAWRAGAPVNPISGRYFPVDIINIPGVQQYATFQQAQAALAASGGKGLILLVDNPFPNWTEYPGCGNFATYNGAYWEWANHGDSRPGRMIKHSPNMPSRFKYKWFYVVPR